MRKITFIFTFTIILLFSCEKGSSEGGFGISQSGSLSTFTFVNNHLCVLQNNKVKVYAVEGLDVIQISELQSSWTGAELETIYPNGNQLFLGSTEGMFIYDLTQPINPTFLGMASHSRACDPVVSDGHYAYVTLRSGQDRCFNAENTLSVYDIENVMAPQLISMYQMSNPFGMGIMDTLLLVCDNGIKVYDRQKPDSLELVHHQYTNGATDLIVDGSNAVVIESQTLGVYQWQSDSLVRLESIQ